MITPTPIEEQICRILTQITEDLYVQQIKTDGPWTKMIKERLGQFGHILGFKTCTSGFKDEHDKEWLYDLVWYQEDEEHLLIDLPLAVESEWNMDVAQIKYDFEKLLAVRAGHRLMICQCRTKYKQDRLEYFRKAVKAYRYRLAGDRYLIALLDLMDASFHFELIVLAEPDTVETLSIEIPEEAT